jgi:Protein of unknown function (DUF1569)
VSLTRRTLDFRDFPAVIADAEMLLAKGYDKVGNWSLGQCTGHLANWLEYQMTGFPPLPLLLKPVFFVVRNTLANKIMRDVVAKRSMSAGSSTAPTSIPPEDVSDAAEVNRLKANYDRWDAYTGKFVSSPLFGEQTRDDWRQLHLVHAAHHLSFLLPKA